MSLRIKGRVRTEFFLKKLLEVSKAQFEAYVLDIIKPFVALLIGPSNILLKYDLRRYLPQGLIFIDSYFSNQAFVRCRTDIHATSILNIQQQRRNKGNNVHFRFELATDIPSY
jgi:hypothetical protein